MTKRILTCLGLASAMLAAAAVGCGSDSSEAESSGTGGTAGAAGSDSGATGGTAGSGTGGTGVTGGTGGTGGTGASSGGSGSAGASGDPDGGVGEAEAGDCPVGTTGPNCDECAEGYQDADDDGVCELGCNATGADALDCGERGSCEESEATGERSCVCATGWDGDLCDACATGWELEDGACEPVLDVLTGLRMWYDADHTIVTNTSDEVTAWPSRSESFTLVSPSGARPTLEPDVWNGRSVVLFDSTGERVASTGSTNALSGEDFTLFVVGGPSNLSAGLGMVSTRTGTNYATFLETTAPGYRFVHRATAAAGSVSGDEVVTSRPVSLPDVIRVLRSGSSAIDILRIDVAEGSDLFAHTNALQITESPTGTNHAFVIGEGPSGSFRGRIGEVLVYDRLLTADETTRVHRYIRWKWDL